MLKGEKNKILEKLKEQLQETPNFILADYRGLSVEEISDLRTQLREKELNMHVVKNTLLRLALEAQSLPALGELLLGPTALIWISEDPVTPARILRKYSEINDKLKLKGGLYEGKVMAAEDIITLSKLPEKEVIYVQILYGINSGATRISMCLKDIAGRIVRFLEAHRKNLEQAAA